MNSSEETKFPKQISLILVSVLFDRFTYYGSKSVLVNYAKYVIGYSDDAAQMMYHALVSLSYTFPLLGAIFGDCWVGKYITIICAVVVYFCGILTVSLFSIESFSVSSSALYMIGFILMAAGNGIMKPCITTFGGDQFILPQQKKTLHIFYYSLYFFINLGASTGTLVFPEIARMQCYGHRNCYSVGFGLGTLLVAAIFVICFFGKRHFTILKPANNILIHWFSCVGYAIIQKKNATENVHNWLDRSEEKYGRELVRDIKTSFRMLSVYLPLIFDWALDVLWVRAWILQGSFMDDELGNGYNIRPTQMLVSNPVLLLILIPLFCLVVYPVCARYNLITTPLQRMGCGGMFIGVSFLIAGILSLIIESNVPILPSKGECHLRIYNPLNCTIKLSAPPYVHNLQLESMGYKFINVSKVYDINIVNYQLSGCENLISVTSDSDFTVVEGETIGYFLSTRNLIQYTDSIQRQSLGYPNTRMLVGNPKEGPDTLTYKLKKQVSRKTPRKTNDFSLFTVEPGIFLIGENESTEVKFHRGGTYTILIFFENGKIKEIRRYEITQQSKLHIFWQLPQYLLFAIGEVMLGPTALEFAYTQAPVSMKTTMTAVWFLVKSFGNALVVIFRLIHAFKKQSNELFLFGGAMLFATTLFVLSAKKYKYVENYNNEETDLK
ncbi:peptide transporter family 1-like isoform X2 [Tenebrio molitor]|uniref:peptide transporter family 1-like isoform X2 n=1 Tax=Tenebrio molitor TaxID=7067 RepID=UPI00362490B1